jgi:glycosyltransferase involved in cell wall biosynthesis
MKEEPLISVALCTYNGEKFISQQLDSILCQTYKYLEIIIVDDCSTDGTFNIVRSYAKKDSRTG